MIGEVETRVQHPMDRTRRRCRHAYNDGPLDLKGTAYEYELRLGDTYGLTLAHLKYSLSHSKLIYMQLA